MGALLGNLQWALFTGDSERVMKEDFGKGEFLSMGTLRGEPGGGVLYWGHRKLCRGMLWKRAALSIAAPLGTWKGLAFRWLWEAVNERPVHGASLSLYENLEGGLLCWKQESCVKCVKEDFEMEHLSPYRGSAIGTWREGSYTEDSWGNVMEGCFYRAL